MRHEVHAFVEDELTLEHDELIRLLHGAVLRGVGLKVRYQPQPTEHRTMPEQDTQQAEVTDFDLHALEIRKDVKVVATEVKRTIEQVRTGNHITSAASGDAEQRRENRGEMLANLTLAYRHLEDASMRLGKAIQAHDGGTSVYDRESTVGV